MQVSNNGKANSQTSFSEFFPPFGNERCFQTLLMVFLVDAFLQTRNNKLTFKAFSNMDEVAAILCFDCKRSYLTFLIGRREHPSNNDHVAELFPGMDWVTGCNKDQESCFHCSLAAVLEWS